MPNLEVDKFSGINQKAREQNLVGPTVGQEIPGTLELRIAKNVDITNRGSVSRRKGFMLELSIPGAHSAKRIENKILVGSDSGILLIDPIAKSSEVITVPQNVQARISWVILGLDVFWSNGQESGMIRRNENFEWGQQIPIVPSGVVLVSGGLDGGKYQVTITAVSNGIESGAEIGHEFDVVAGGGIQLSGLPQNADKFRVYLTEVNGSTFYHSVDYFPGTMSLTLTNKLKGKALKTQFMSKPPIGSLTAYLNGRIYIAFENVIWYTEAQMPHHCKISKSFLPPFANDIKMIRPVEDGIFVDDGILSFVPIAPNGDVSKIRKLDSDYTVKLGTDLEVPGSWFGFEETAFVGFWWTDKGFPVVGLPGGLVKLVGEDRIAVNDFRMGASLLRDRAGIKQLLTSFSQEALPSGFGMSDSLEVTVISRGREQ